MKYLAHSPGMQSFHLEVTKIFYQNEMKVHESENQQKNIEEIKEHLEMERKNNHRGDN